MVSRDINNLLLTYAGSFRSVLLVGPRQSGKSTLSKQSFQSKPYVSLENPDEKLLAETDPRAFLSRFPNGAILDEIQRVPILLNFLQEILDNTKEDGLFILTGSNNILLQESVSQSLAGRIGILELLPFSYQEILKINQQPKSLSWYVFNGCYPEIFDRKRNPTIWYPSYIKTYLERDVRLIRNIENQSLFVKFLKLCAGRIGQTLNIASLSNECGIDIKTVQAWLSVLESTFVVKLLYPHHRNFNKRVVKSPKLYFYDTGLACSLLGIKKEEELSLSHFKGALVENYIILEFLKHIKNYGLNFDLYYWRDNKGVEVDLLIDKGNDILIPIEIKSAQTFQQNFTNNLTKYISYSNQQKAFVVYNGTQQMKLSSGIELINWSNIRDLVFNL